MLGEIESAWNGEPWSLSGVVHTLAAACDDDRRPLGEGRAPVEVRDGVPMVKKRCPYRDERFQRWMNVSALTQMTGRLDEVLADVVRFRSHLERPATWEGVAATLMSRMAGPAICLLDHRDRAVPVPVAVGYKLAAGYTTPVRELLLASARGESIEVSVAGLHRHVRARNHLVGAREVCAAPDNMLDRVTGAFVCQPAASPADGVDPRLLAVARLLAQQIHLGVCWELYDLAMERALLIDDVGRARMEPRTPYVRRIVDERLAELPDHVIPAIADIALPASLSAAHRAVLASAIAGDAPAHPSRAETRALVRAVARHGDAVIQIPEQLAGDVVADRFAGYIAAYCSFTRVYVDLEQAIRDRLAVDTAAPVKLTGGMLPIPRCLRWLELMVGHRFRFGPPPDGELVLRNQHRSVDLPAALWQ